MAGIHDYSTPKGEFHEIKIQDGNGKVEVKFEIKWNPGFGPELSNTFNSMQEYVDNQVLFLCQPMVPKDTNTLIESGILNTQIGNGEVKYRTPYARRWYYMPASFSEAPERGNYWFERMKQQYKEKILAGAKKIAGGQS